eukprot:c18417_g1_i1 orf=187-447(-)
MDNIVEVKKPHYLLVSSLYVNMKIIPTTNALPFLVMANSLEGRILTFVRGLLLLEVERVHEVGGNYTRCVHTLHTDVSKCGWKMEN